MVLTPLVFAVAGFGLDAWLGTRPLLTIVLGLLALVGKLLVEWYRYAARMDHHEEALTANRNAERRDLKPTDSPHAIDVDAAGGPASGGPASGGPASGGPAVGGPASGGLATGVSLDEPGTQPGTQREQQQAPA